ncbi:MAG: family 16 glycosylhydrolase [Chloroflexi bacterium]|nr:family 16 glycosylhydrolase [Chloroflexota bacterium]
MRIRYHLILVLLLVLSLWTWVIHAQEAGGRVIDDFEIAEVFEGRDSHNNAIGHAPWGDQPGNVSLGLATMEHADVSSTVLAINYDIGGWGGFTHAFTDSENWLSQDWRAHNALSFWLHGNNTGGTIQVEIFDNRNPNLNNDTAERWFYRIADDYEGWMAFSIPFRSFQRRSDWQPGGAPDDGLGLDKVSAYAFGFPAGTGAQTAYLDDVRLVTLGVDPLAVEDFEEYELFLAQDSFGNDIGFAPWGDTAGNVELRLTDAKRNGQETRALNVNYDIAAWGGFSHVFNDGDNWTSRDWREFNAISLWFLGSNTGGAVQLEIFDNRDPKRDGDSAERWFARFDDDSYGWQQLEIPFADFDRRSDWQPEGAPDDGFNLDAVSGYALGFPAGTGGSFAIIDDIELIFMPGVDLPELPEQEAAVAEAADAPALAQPAAVKLNEALLEPMSNADPVVIADFERGVAYVSQVDGPAIGFVPWGDSTANAIIGITQVIPFTDLALPDQSAPNQVLRVDYNIGAWGGFTYAFTDGASWVSQDWTGHNAFQFWLYGNNTGQIVQIELFDNRQPENNADTAERFFYHLLDDYSGWQQFTIPFAYFQRRADWQPGGAPDDGFNLDAVWGVAFGFPGGVGAQSAFLDQVEIVVVDDPTMVQTSAQTVVTTVEVDESIGWDTREWDLLWSDEFDAAAGTPIDDASWTCEIGGHGWGNNEMEYYTDRVENVSHDGAGNLVITAREETLADSTCHYGECQYTSARCITQDKVEFTYGRVEARIDIPNGQGIWPALWMLGANFPELGWPLSGEIDILENIGEKNVVYGALHGPGYSGGGGIGGAYRADVNLDEGFHVYAIDWDPYVIRWYVDGELSNLISVNALDGKQWVYDHDFFMLMNLAVGGYWPGYPDETTEFPQEMIVDYVRVYQLGSQ